MDYRFREIRRGERDKVIDFAVGQGLSYRPESLHHHLSLVARVDGQLVAAALCIETQPAQFVIEIVHSDATTDELITELTDRCLRKVQSENITSARINSPDTDATQALWTATNWLDHIQETPPPPEVHLEGSPEVVTADGAAACAL